jgi:hypothetical protein
LKSCVKALTAIPSPDSGLRIKTTRGLIWIERPRPWEGGASFFDPAIPVLALLLTLLAPFPSLAQEWNAPGTLQLIEEARVRRHSGLQDPDFQSYSSQARGYVHFFLDREDTGERILVKTDQIALEVYWQAPNRTRQRIVGLRDEKSLPTNINYHLDHLTVVQDEFGDRIRIGDGDEVEAVLHPAAPGAEDFYDFLLSDSITLTLQGAPEAIRVYEILVRPKDPELPAFIGSVFLDRASKAIVRMNFTFTPVSYVDSYLDHIQISLENGLWNGQYWLPYRQQLEIRREVPWLDIPAGSVIKGWFEVRDYEINPPLSEALFRGPAVTILPEEARRAFPFEDSLHAHLDTEGFLPPPEMGEIRSMALELASAQRLSGLGGLRLHLPEPIISSGLRFNRAEGLFLGGGFSYGLHPSLSMAAHGGFSFGRERPAGRLTFTGGERAPATGITGFLNQPRDLGPTQAISGAMNTLAAVVWDQDYQDLFFSSGVQAFHQLASKGRASLDLLARWEDHGTARDVVSSDPLQPRFRPVLETEEGLWRSVEASATAASPWKALSLHGVGLLGRFDDRTFGHFSGSLDLHRRWLTQGVELRGTLQGGALIGDAPRQALFLLGGRETVPGYPFRSRVGNGYWLLKAQGSRDLMAPWIRLRAFGAAGGTHSSGEILPEGWPQDQTNSFLLSGGLGLGLGWDVLRLDLARGLTEGGEWELILSLNHAFWAWL